MRIGEQVKRERYRQTLTQVQLAKRAHITVAALSRIEANKSDPHVSTIRKLADALEVDPRELLEGLPTQAKPG
jgi:transcriptional regulator with XRE-family HTH domain